MQFHNNDNNKIHNTANVFGTHVLLEARKMRFQISRLIYKHSKFTHAHTHTHNFNTANVFGTHVLLEACKMRMPQIRRFIHVSTDEVGAMHCRQDSH
jgi:dTDP-D-glucose 4,6-dehydratase